MPFGGHQCFFSNWEVVQGGLKSWLQLAVCKYCMLVKVPSSDTTPNRHCVEMLYDVAGLFSRDSCVCKGTFVHKKGQGQVPRILEYFISLSL